MVDHSKTIVVKVTAGPRGVYRIADRYNVHVANRPLLTRELEWMNGDPIAYFNGAWSSVVGWGLSERIANQGW